MLSNSSNADPVAAPTEP